MAAGSTPAASSSHRPGVPVVPWQIPLRAQDGKALTEPKIRRAVQQRCLLDQYWLPHWIQLYPERGSMLKCYEGHRLFAAQYDRRRHGECARCYKRPRAGTPIMVCRACEDYSICPCCVHERKCNPLPSLSSDPLFQGPDSPCLLQPPSARAVTGRGTVIVCPGGNYEFLCANEGMPVAEMFIQHNISAMVLRYRLLPRHGHSSAVSDMAAAVRMVRRLTDGPVAAIGFSAGGHLIASFSQQYGAPKAVRRRLASKGPLGQFGRFRHLSPHANKVRRHGKPQLDAQVLVYPAIDGLDWLDEDSTGFYQFDECFPHGPALNRNRRALLGGPGFAAPPSFLVASTSDPVCPPRIHTDVYAAAMTKRRIPHHYLRRNFGNHGFALSGGWTRQCIKWLEEQGFGGSIPP